MPKISTTKTTLAPKTEAEQILQSIEAAHKELTSRNKPGFGFQMPKRRYVKKGEKVILGNLHDVVVEQDFIDGMPEHVVVRYTRIDNNYGRPIRTENLFKTVHLSDIFKTLDPEPNDLKGDGLSDVFKKLRHSSRMIESILHEKSNWASDNPDFQRGYVWTLEDKQKLIMSVLRSQPLGSIIIARDESFKTGEFFILDGKQRINALAEFYCGCYPVMGRHFDELSGTDIGTFTQAIISVYYLDLQSVSKKEVLELFLLVNSAGVPQTEEHLVKVKSMLENLND